MSPQGEFETLHDNDGGLVCTLDFGPLLIPEIAFILEFRPFLG